MQKMKNLFSSYKTTIAGLLAAFLFAFQSGAADCLVNGNIDAACFKKLLFSCSIAAIGVFAKDLNVTGNQNANDTSNTK